LEKLGVSELERGHVHGSLWHRSQQSEDAGKGGVSSASTSVYKNIYIQIKL
jgi:hypothetical protein